MGMFDKVIISPKFKLPLTAAQLKTINKITDGKGLTNEFQTKDLVCWLQNYTISPTGLLSVEHKDNKFKREKYTGTLNVYDFLTCDTGPIDVWLEFEFKLVDGKIVKSKTVRFDRTNNTDRIADKKKFDEQHEIRLARQKTILYKAYKYMYSKPIRFLLGRVAESCMWLHHRCAYEWRHKLLFWDH